MDPEGPQGRLGGFWVRTLVAVTAQLGGLGAAGPRLGGTFGNGDWCFTRGHLLKSKKVVIVQSDLRALEPLAVGKYLSHRQGWGGGENRVESASGGGSGS